MNKKEAFDLFGGAANLAKLLGLTRQALQLWEDPLNQRRTDELTGLALRHLLPPWQSEKIRHIMKLHGLAMFSEDKNTD